VNRRLFALLASILLSQFSGPARSFAETPFYEGKTVTIVQSTEPGGSGDLRPEPLPQHSPNISPAIP
jgi:hypothetical protein